MTATNAASPTRGDPNVQMPRARAEAVGRQRRQRRAEAVPAEPDRAMPGESASSLALRRGQMPSRLALNPR